MADYIKREDVLHALFNGEHNLYSWFEIEEKLDAIPSADVQPVVRCKDCKHRPIAEDDYISEPGEIYSDYTCPYLCDDCWYNRMPEDSWFCNHGERKDGG